MFKFLSINPQQPAFTASCGLQRRLDLNRLAIPPYKLY